MACSVSRAFRTSRKIRRKQQVKALSIVALFGMFSGSFAHAQLQFFTMGPAKTVSIIENHPPQFGLTVKRVAFGNPEGSCPNQATELIDSKLLPVFQQGGMDVIERQALDQIMSEHNFSQSGYEDPNSVAQLGKILGPSALIIVSVNTCSTEQQPLFSDQRNFLNNQIVRTFISKTRYSLEGSLRVVNLTTGQILDSHPFQSHQERTNNSQQGQPEFPPVDEVKDAAMQDVQNQVQAMFFPSGDRVALDFYGDKDCGLNQVYEMYKNGDADGALHLMDTNLEQCRTNKHKDKTLARAYYDDGLLHCLRADYDKASALFTSAMDSKGADAVGQASATCQRARSGAAALKDYEARLAQIQAPPPINNQPSSPPAPAAAPPVQAVAPVTPSTRSAPSGETPEARLKELDSLYKRGLITKKEYDDKRAEILQDL